jgi:hypothetical protein
MIDVNAILPIVSLLVTIGTIGIGIGVFQTKMQRTEKDVSGMREKIDRDIVELKKEHIRPLADKLNSSEQDRRHLGELMSKIEGLMTGMDKRLDKIESKLEKRGDSF